MADHPNSPGPEPGTILHATCVAFEGAGVLILGASGRGKSALGLELMARGAVLVSDDRVQLNLHGQQVIARAPETIRGLIEARGVGVLKAETLEQVPIALVIDLDQTETERLPVSRQALLLDQPVPLLHKVEGALFVPALVQYLRGGRYPT